MNNILLKLDCMEYMVEVPDNHFDLAIVDPPYTDNFRISTSNNLSIVKMYDVDNLINKAPDKEYFDNLFRVSKNQIIWGVNYFYDIRLQGGRIVWDKDNTGNFSGAEISYQSFSNTTIMYKYRWNGMIQQNMKNKEHRIHPTQKPIKLYKWLLTNYAKPGMKLFDSHSGSGSFRIAAYDMGFDLVSCELDADYCRDNEARFQKHIQQQELFPPEEIQESIYKDNELFS